MFTDQSRLRSIADIYRWARRYNALLQSSISSVPAGRCYCLLSFNTIRCLQQTATVVPGPGTEQLKVGDNFLLETRRENLTWVRRSAGLPSNEIRERQQSTSLLQGFGKRVPGKKSKFYGPICTFCALMLPERDYAQISLLSVTFVHRRPTHALKLSAIFYGCCST